VADLHRIYELRCPIHGFIPNHCKELIVAREEAGKSWYKVDKTDIPVVSESQDKKVRPLLEHSPVVKSMKPTRKISLYALPEKAEVARAMVAKLVTAANQQG
jgi:hypothetical protein